MNVIRGRTLLSLLLEQTSCRTAHTGLFVFLLAVKEPDICVISCHVHTKQMGIIEVCWQFSWSRVLEMLLRWILPHECPKEASLHTVPVKPCHDTPISQQAEHCGWRLLSQHGRMIGPRCSLPSLPLIMASAERSQRMQTPDHPGCVSSPWEYDRVGDLSLAPLMRCKLWRHLKGQPHHCSCFY